MAYSDFTLELLEQRFGLTVNSNADQFADVPEIDLSQVWHLIAARNMPLAANATTEKARSEYLVSPMLVELKARYQDRVGLFSGIAFDVDPTTGLNGRCDYILTRNPEQLELRSPVCVTVEAKNENIPAGVPQCLAEMVAAQRFNGGEGEMFGAVTTGFSWRFLRLAGRAAAVDTVEYPIQNPRKIFGILTHMVLG